MPRPDDRDREYHLHIHQGADAEVVAAIQTLVETVETSVGTILAKIDQQGEQMATDFTRIESEIAENRSVIESAVTLLGELSQAIRDAVSEDNTAKLTELADELDASSNRLGEAIQANTPADPTTPPEEPPA